jgi:hypothetical protein
METNLNFRNKIRAILDNLLNFVERYEVSLTNNLNDLIDLTIENDDIEEFIFIKRLNKIKRQLNSLKFNLNVRENWRISRAEQKRLFKELKRYQRSLNSDRNRESIEDKLKKIVVLLKKFVKSKKDQINLDMNRTEIINLNDDQTESEGDSEGDSDHDEQEHHSDSEPENEESKIGESHHNSHTENREINLDSESNQEDLGIDYARINEPRIISLEEEKDLEEINLEELKDQNDSSLEFDLRGIFLIKKHSSTLREKDNSNLVMNTFFSNSKRFFLILMS